MYLFQNNYAAGLNKGQAWQPAVKRLGINQIAPPIWPNPPEGFCLVRDHGDLHAKSVFMVNCPLSVEALLQVLARDFEAVSRREQEPSKDRRHAGRPAHDAQAQGGRPLQFVPCQGALCRQCQSATRRSDGLAQGRLGRSARVKNTKKLFLCPDCFLLQIVCPTLSLVPHTIFFPQTN